jgi:16S rRNA (uracil1498-N3)-methyltransferase
VKHRFRFFSPNLSGSLITLDDEEHRHLAQVLRLQPGTEVEVFDGCGHVATASIIATHKKSTDLSVVAQDFVPRPAYPLWLGLGALSRGDLKDIVPALVELGVDRLLLFRHASIPKQRLEIGDVATWQRTLIAAAKQSKRAWLPSIERFDSLQDFCTAILPQASYRYEFSPEGSSQPFSFLAPGPIVGIVGSEMGFSIDEQSLIRSFGVTPVGLGSHVLRATTAAIAGLAVLSHVKISGSGFGA